MAKTQEKKQYLICPNTETCVVYKEWAYRQENHFIDIIETNLLGNKKVYRCKALMELSHKLNKIEASESFLERKIQKSDDGFFTETGCSTIEILNKLQRK